MPPLRAALRRALPSRTSHRIAIAAAVALALISLLTQAFQDPSAPRPGRPTADVRAEAGAGVAGRPPIAAPAAPVAVDCGSGSARDESRRPGAYCPSRTLPTELIIGNAE